MEAKLGETIYLDFTTRSPSTQEVCDADETPTAEVFESDSSTPLDGVSVGQRTGRTGNYYAAIACTAENGFEADKCYNVVVRAVVEGKADKARIGSFVLRSKSLSELTDEATWTDSRAAKLDNLDAQVSSRAPADTALSKATWTDERAQKLDRLDAAVSSRSTLTADEAADAVWDEALAEHTTEGSAGKALASAGAAGDPWGVELPGDYPEGTAGYRVGVLLDRRLSTVGGTIVLSARSNQVTVDASGEGIGGTGDITVVRGTSVTVQFTAQGKALVDHDLYMTVRPNREDLDDPEDKTAVFSVPCVVTGEDTFSVTLTPTETNNCRLGWPYWYEIRDITAQDSLLIARFRVVGSVVKRTA